MGDGSSSARAFLACATIVSLIVFVAGLCLLQFIGPPVLHAQDSHRLLLRLAGRLQDQMGDGYIAPDARRALQRYAAITRPLLLLVTDPGGRVMFSVPAKSFLMGKGVNTDRRSLRYGQVLIPRADDGEAKSTARFYPPGHAVLAAKVQNGDGEPAGYIWQSRAPTPALAPYAWPAAFGGVAYWLFLSWWVFVDARIRRARALAFAILTLVTNAAGWAAYMVSRPEHTAMCSGCGRSVEPGFRICPTCGQPVAGRCHNCGAPMRGDWRFCPYCEKALPDAEQQEAGCEPSDDISPVSIISGQEVRWKSRP